MFDTKQEGTLAGTHAGKPGLPRGRSRLPAPTVQASQRERLLRAAVAAVAAKGYSAVTVADIVRQARVSRAAFYLHFRGREDCFLAATRRGGQLLFGHVIEAARAVTDDAPDEAYQALAGATAELIRSWVSADKTEALPELEDTLVALHLAVMAARPWTTAASHPQA